MNWSRAVCCYALVAIAAITSGCAGMRAMSDREVYTYADEAYVRGDYKRAITFYSEMVRRRKAHAEVFARRGVAYDRIGQPYAALADLEQAIDRAPHSPAANLARLYHANIALRQGELDKAQADLAAIPIEQLDPHEQVAALTLKGTLLQKRGDLGNAIAVYKEAIEIGRKSHRRARKHYLDALYNAASCYYRLGAFDEAAALYGEFVARKPTITDEDHYTLGLLLYLNGDFENARAHFRHVDPERRAEAAKVLNDDAFFASI